MPLDSNALFCGCAPAQSTLRNYFGKNTPEGRDSGDTSTLQLLLSGMNRQGLEQIENTMVTSQSKLRTVILSFDKPICGVTACLDELACDEAPAKYIPEDDCLEYQVGEKWTSCIEGAPTGLELNCEVFAKWCERNDLDYAQRKINQWDEKFFEGMDRTILTRIKTEIIDASPTNVADMKIMCPTTDGCGLKVNTTFFAQIGQWFRDQKMANCEYFILGGSMVKWIQEALKMQTASCEGVDITKYGAYPPMYYDMNFDTITGLGPNALVVIPVGSIHLVPYAENNRTCKNFEDGRLIQKTRTYNFGNGSLLEYDYKWTFDPECGIYCYKPSIHMDLISCLGGSCDIEQDHCPVLQINNCTPLDFSCPA